MTVGSGSVGIVILPSDVLRGGGGGAGASLLPSLRGAPGSSSGCCCCCDSAGREEAAPCMIGGDPMGDVHEADVRRL